MSIGHDEHKDYLYESSLSIFLCLFLSFSP